MKIFIRIIRVILGLALLAAFAFGLYTFAQAAPKSGDYLAQLEEQPAPVSPVVVTTPKPASAAPQDGENAAPAEGGTESPAVEPAPEPTPLPNTPAARAAALGLPEPPNVDITSWEFMLVNGDHSISMSRSSLAISTPRSTPLTSRRTSTPTVPRSTSASPRRCSTSASPPRRRV